MEKIFDWNVKEKPEDFIVSEVASYPLKENGKFYLYRLVKKNLNTNDLSKKLGFRYAGLKDKNAITFQYVLFNRYVGESIYQKLDRNTFYGLIYLGRTSKKISIGFLKGNRFSVKLKCSVNERDFFINYFDLQRVYKNWERGLKLFLSDKPGKKFSWLDHFLIDSFLSFLWNAGVQQLIKEHYTGYYILEKDFKFFIPETDFNSLFSVFPKFFPILGYKVKLNETERNIYEKVLQDFNLSYSKVIERLRDIKIKGDYRKTFLKPEDVYIKGNRINFFIPKGGYATMYLKHIV